MLDAIVGDGAGVLLARSSEVEEGGETGPAVASIESRMFVKDDCCCAAAGRKKAEQASAHTVALDTSSSRRQVMISASPGCD